MTARLREALLADAATTQYANALEIETLAGRVFIGGTVDDIKDDDSIVAVASGVTGVDEVIDRLDADGI